MTMTLTTQELKDLISRAFQRDRPKCVNMPTRARVLPLDYTFEGEDFFRSDRFIETKKYGILYRHDIVADMEAKLPGANENKGLFVSGSRGVGKSHSLVNLARKLRADGHIVTFIPDCRFCRIEYLLWGSILRSLGYTEKQVYDLDIEHDKINGDLIFQHIALKILPTLKKRWIFIFDHINLILRRARVYLGEKICIGQLPDPSHYMELLNGKNGITTVISSSANTAIPSSTNNHGGFAVYDHKKYMTEHEWKQWMKGWKGWKTWYFLSLPLSYENQDRLKELTRFCPLQIVTYLKCLEHRWSYEDKVNDKISYDVDELLMVYFERGDERGENSIIRAGIHSVLGIPDTQNKITQYDRGYFFEENRYFRPLFPFVLQSYFSKFYKEIIEYIENEEGNLLKLVANHDVEERLFELMVINKLKAWCKPWQSDLFPGKQLPHPRKMLVIPGVKKLFIPQDLNFPAVDCILNDGRSVWGIKIHIGECENVLPLFHKMCKEQGWFEYFENINLMYLSPCHKRTDLLKGITRRPRSKSESIQNNETIHVLVTNTNEFRCLDSISKFFANLCSEDNTDDIKIS